MGFDVETVKTDLKRLLKQGNQLYLSLAYSTESGAQKEETNEELKNAGVIDLPTWRHIQLLGDLRNLCCHDKKSEPTKDQAKDLLDGTTKICKTVY